MLNLFQHQCARLFGFPGIGMMRLARSASLLLAFLLLHSVAHAATLRPGRWALRTGGKAMLILELHAPSAGSKNWSGSLTRPLHFNGTASSFTSVIGPAVTEQIVLATQVGATLEIATGASAAHRTTYVWRLNDDGTGDLSIEGVPGTALPFSRAAIDDKVVDSWDAGKTYVVDHNWPSNAEMAAIFKVIRPPAATPQSSTARAIRPGGPERPRYSKKASCRAATISFMPRSFFSTAVHLPTI